MEKLAFTATSTGGFISKNVAELIIEHDENNAFDLDLVFLDAYRKNLNERQIFPNRIRIIKAMDQDIPTLVIEFLSSNNRAEYCTAYGGEQVIQHIDPLTIDNPIVDTFPFTQKIESL